MDINDLKPAPYNATVRRIEDDAAAGLRHSIEKHGDISGITFNKRTGNLVAGHQRLEQLKALGGEMDGDAVVLPGGERFPVRFVDWTLAHEMEANLTANNRHVSGGFAIDDPEAAAHVDAILGGLPDAEQALSGLRALRADFGEVDKVDAADIEEDEVPEPPSEPVTKPGDVWELGEHRLVCGDSSAVESYGSCMAQMVFTDPPYGVDYTGGAKARDRLQSDHVGTCIYKQVLPMCYAHSDDKAPLYLWYADGHAAAAAAAAAAAGYIIVGQIIWAKNHAQFMSNANYKAKHEPCYYAKKKSGARWHGPGNEVTLWECDRSPRNDFHPTQKPVYLAHRAICNSTKVGDTVLDSFAGSGSTLIASEQAGRKCHTIEIEPKYCDVIIERWEQLTGGKAKRTTG